MSLDELLVLLPLGALCLWLTLFLFTLVDHVVYRGTYGHFLMGVDAIEREGGTSPAAMAAMARHMRTARTRYLARYVRNAGSKRGPARLAAEAYIARMGAERLAERASEAGARRRATRLAALYALTRTGHPAALGRVEQALRSPHPVLAYAALDMLDIMGSREAAEALLDALDAGVLPASRIATHLENFPIDLADVYVPRLGNGQPQSRYWIAYLLGRSAGDGRTTAILEALLSDPAPDVRKAALASLAALGSPGLWAHAERMLDDPVFFVRTQAARLLAGCPQPRVVHALARKLADGHDAVQLAAKRSLVELGALTLEHLPHCTSDLAPAARAAVGQISDTIRNALAPGTESAAHLAEVSHAR